MENLFRLVDLSRVAVSVGYYVHNYIQKKITPPVTIIEVQIVERTFQIVNESTIPEVYTFPSFHTIPKFYFIIPILLLLSFVFGLMLVLSGARRVQQEASKADEVNEKEKKLYDIDTVLLLMKLASIIGQYNPDSPQSQVALSGSGLFPFFGAAEYVEPIELFRRSSTALPSAPSPLFGSAEYIKPIQLFRRSSNVLPSRVKLSSGSCLAPSGPSSQVASCVSVELSSGRFSAPTKAPHTELMLPSPHVVPFVSVELSSGRFSAPTEAPHTELILPSPHVVPFVSVELSSGRLSAPTEAPHTELILPSPHVVPLVSVELSSGRLSAPTEAPHTELILPSPHVVPLVSVELSSGLSLVPTEAPHIELLLPSPHVDPLVSFELSGRFLAPTEAPHIELLLPSPHLAPLVSVERSLVRYSPPLSHRYLLASKVMEVLSIASVQPLLNYQQSDYQSVQERSLVLYSPPLSHSYLLALKLMETISIVTVDQPLLNYQQSDYQSVQERSLVLYSPPLSHRYLLVSKLMEAVSIASVQPLLNYQQSDYQSVQERSLVLYSPPLSHRYLLAPVTVVSVDESFFRYLPPSFDSSIHYQELDFCHPIYLPFLPPRYAAGELYPKGIKKTRSGTRGGGQVQIRRFNARTNVIYLWILYLEKPTREQIELLNWLHEFQFMCPQDLDPELIKEFSLLDEEELDPELLNWTQEFQRMDPKELECPQQNSPQEPDFSKRPIPGNTTVQELDEPPSEQPVVEIVQPVLKPTKVNKQSEKYKEKLDASTCDTSTAGITSNDTNNVTTTTERPSAGITSNDTNNVTTTTERPSAGITSNDTNNVTTTTERPSAGITSNDTNNVTTTTERPSVSTNRSTNHNENFASTRTTNNDRRFPRSNYNDKRSNYNSKSKRKMTLEELNRSMGL